MLAGCGGQAANESAAESNQANIVDLPVLPVPSPPMDRAALLTAAAQAASAIAAGTDDREAQRKLDGNRFEMRIRFGCMGPVPADEERMAGWRFDPKSRTLRVQATPDVLPDDPAIAAVAGEGFEAVEGFWIARPWILQDACPARPDPAVAVDTADKADAGQSAPKPKAAPKPVAEDSAEAAAIRRQGKPSHSVAIAQFFTATDSRLGRRDHRPYKATKLLPEGAAPSASGYNLVLSGRLKRLPDGRTIACHAEGPDARPQCVISADFDRAWIERPDTRELVAEWSSGG